MRTDPSIELANGTRYTPTGISDMLDLESMAHSLGNQCRYTGHCRTFYSVAEHSVLCSLLAEQYDLCDSFEALMHDGHEALLSDMAKPWKRYLPTFVQSERLVEEEFRARYGLPEEMTDGCKEVDMLALFIEAYWLMPSKGKDWYDPSGLRKRALEMIVEDKWRVASLEPAQAKSNFIIRFNQLHSNGR